MHTYMNEIITYPVMISSACFMDDLQSRMCCLLIERVISEQVFFSIFFLGIWNFSATTANLVLENAP